MVGSPKTEQMAEVKNSYSPQGLTSEGIPKSLIFSAKEQALKLVIPEERFNYPKAPGITIDPKGCKDRDDAIYVNLLDDGRYRVLITVASVGEFIPEGSPIDTIAKIKGFTTYQKGKAVDLMLPSELSQGKLSLIQGQLRPALTIDIVLSEHADLEKIDIQKTCYLSPGEFSYEDALKMLQDPSNEYYSMLNNAAKLAEELLYKRTGRQWKKNKEFGTYTVHSIIEEIMVLANHAMAEYAIAYNLPVIFRNHPDLYEDCPEELRSGRAYYSFINRGHAGLSVGSYDRGTSSLRRIDDVHNTRVIANHLDGKIPNEVTDDIRKAPVYMTLRERQGRRVS